MGRAKKYHTDEEKRQAKLARWKRWYEKNKKTHNINRMKKYYENTKQK
jgi:hypothetical protein